MKKLFRFRYVLWLAPSLLVLSLVAVLVTNKITNNIHTVLPQKLYRSAQLDLTSMHELIQQQKIKSVVNLRGAHPAESWYQEEINLVSKENLQHYNIELPAHGLPTRAELKFLVVVLETAPKPVLVHCRQGADRTGLAAAIGVILSGNTDPKAATRQVSWRYNVLSPQSVGLEVFNNYFAWLTAKKLPYGKASFLAWLNATTPLKSYYGNLT